MTILQIELPDIIEFALAPRDTAYGQLSVDAAKLQAVAGQIFYYGLTQKVRDAASDKKDKSINEVRAMSLKCIDQLHAGEWRVRGESGEPTDPVEARAYHDCKRDLLTLYGNTPEAKQVPKGTRGDDRMLWIANTRAEMRHKPTYESVADLVGQVLDDKPQYRKEAAKHFADQSKRLGDIEV